MHATKWEEANIVGCLRYPLNLELWGSAAESTAHSWLYESLNVDVSTVQRVNTPSPRFRDFDLVARLRATTGQLELLSGCQGSIVVDGQFGMHESNTGWLYDGMWYKPTIAVATVRCHEGHPEHFVSWLVPQTSTWLGRIQGRIIARLGGGSFTCTDAMRRTAFAVLNSKVKHKKRRRR